jgi:prepilin-type N-terminal cleavage/methylation domain-containing protein
MKINKRSRAAARTETANTHAFSLVELLVVVAIIAILASLSLPALARGREKATVAVVRSDLLQLGLALDMYATDHEGRVPPVRENCNSDLALHWCQLPVELADQGYVPRGPDGGLAARFMDKFQPGHSYKYAAPGPLLMNNTPGGSHRMWVPEDFPNNASTNGAWFQTNSTAPVKWAVWSLGPQPDSEKSQSTRAPLPRSTWYLRTGGDGVITRWAARDGTQFTSP